MPLSFGYKKEIQKSKDSSPFLAPHSLPLLYVAPAKLSPLPEHELEGWGVGPVTSAGAQHMAGTQTFANNGPGLPASQMPPESGTQSKAHSPRDGLWPSCSLGTTYYAHLRHLPGAADSRPAHPSPNHSDSGLLPPQRPPDPPRGTKTGGSNLKP